MALTSDQLADFRLDIGDDGTVFTDEELNRLYERASDDYESAVVLALRQLMAQSSKLRDYKIAQSSESNSQIFDHIKTLLEYHESRITASQQVSIVGMRSVPPRYKDRPDA